MRKLCTATLLIVATLMSYCAAAPDLKDFLNGLSGKASSTTTTDDTQSTSTGSTGTDILGSLTSLGNALGIIPSQTVNVEYLTGTWNYNKPAVAFKSDNFLAKAGGVAASAKIESELAPYYKKIGLISMSMAFAADSTFVMKLKRGSLNGTVSTNAKDGTLIFNFTLKGIPVGQMTAYVNAESSKAMSITFDVTKLMAILQKVAMFSGNSSLQALSSLLNNYDGLTAGFRMTKK